MPAAAAAAAGPPSTRFTAVAPVQTTAGPLTSFRQSADTAADPTCLPSGPPELGGGAIWAADMSAVSVDSCEGTDNAALGSTGAVVARGGFAAAVQGSSLSVSRSALRGNRAAGSGGALHSSGSGSSVASRDSVFSGNSAFLGGVLSAEGLYGIPWPAQLSNLTLVNNRATAGALFALADGSELADASVANSADGAAAGYPMCEGCRKSNNSASSYGDERATPPSRRAEQLAFHISAADPPSPVPNPHIRAVLLTEHAAPH